ncbi:zinc finger protein 850-like isoform X1 [Ranitomeya imitator]|uniref:zinc finger protein 850-like isoform X1 n=2 Tax=Ranitomeya imitator TaxID=111125 RepID=UPI0037E949E0
MEQALVTFEDVAIYFTRREWELLDEEQKTLYKEVMNDNYQMILSLNRPDIILNIELGFEPYVQSKSERDCTGFWPEKNVKDGSCFPESCGVTTSRGCEVRRQRRYPRVNPIRWIKKDKKRKRRLSRSSRQISRRSEDTRESGEYQIQTSPEKTTYNLSTCSSLDPAGDPPDESAGKDLSSDDGSAAQSSRTMEKAVDTRSGRFRGDTKQCEAAARGFHELSTMGCSHEEDGLNPALSSDAADYKDLTISEISDIPWKANNESHSKRTTPKNEHVKKEKRSPSSKKKVSHHKKDRHVKFSEVVTMILIDHHHEECSAENQGGEVKLRSTHLPICYSVNEKDKKKCSSAVFVENDIASALLKTAEGTKKATKSSQPDIAKLSKERIFERSESSQRPPELKAWSPTIKQKRELHGMEINKVVNVRLLNVKIKDIKLDTCSTSAQPKSPISGHEPRLIKSYSCSKCGKITHWSKLTVHQKENIEKSVAHMCRTCGHHTSRSSATYSAQAIHPLSLTTTTAQPIPPHSFTSAPAQSIHPLSLTSVPAQTIPPLSPKTAPVHTIPPLSLITAPAQTCPLSITTAPGSVASASPVNYSQKISVCSPSQPNTEISSTEKKESRQKDETKKKTTENLRILITAGDQYKKPPHTAQHHTDVCSKCDGLKLDLKVKPFTGSSATHTSTIDTTALDLTWSRIGSKDNKVASKCCSEQPGKNVDSKEHKVCRKCGEWFIPKQRNQPLSSDQKVRPAESSLRVLQKTQGCPKAALTMDSTYMDISDPQRSLAAENHTSEKDCIKCGKRLALHVTANPGDPAEDGEKKCVLRLKKKRKRLLDGIQPFKCKECGKIFTRHFTLLQHSSVHTGERPFSCKECGKSFRDGGYLKVHMRQHTKEKPYPCSECGKCFGQNSALVRHQRIHTDEKPFKCGECGKRFSDLSTFRHHQVIHTGEKPFSCSFCGKKFTQKAHVKRHEKMHTGERPFGCTMCEKRFIDRTKLKKHELIHMRKKV